MLPAICRCSWSELHSFPWMARANGSDVVATFKRFRMGMADSGSVKLPMRQRSKRQSLVCSPISLSGWSCNILEPSGCSKWKCSDLCTWNRYRTMAKLICQRLARRFWRMSCNPWSDLFRPIRPIGGFHTEPCPRTQGPHSGLYHRFLGFWVVNTWNILRRPAAVWRSPSANPNLLERPPMDDICFVSSLSLEHMTSNKSSWGSRNLFFWFCWITWSSSDWNCFTIRWIRRW